MPTLTLKLAAPQGRLAPGASLEAASHVIVREVPATDWGTRGKTHQARRALRQEQRL